MAVEIQILVRQVEVDTGVVDGGDGGCGLDEDGVVERVGEGYV